MGEEHQPVEYAGNQIRFTITPYEIKTLAVRLGGRQLRRTVKHGLGQERST